MFSEDSKRGEVFVLSNASGLGEWLRLTAVTIASSLLTLMDGCGLSHERVEDGCKSTYVKFGG